ncbi:oxalate:formate antiporter-like isoform X1 [Elysia marginata]|uniref:Oxalate:formate antiporter-like isoform X1 n=1 Tax=Elysia marginata TaxID=1093978 RepID=A0AAV4J6B2_9GAST|nr:oxalate:formate antiporter-like isoform X1 [Elysia marginata]
MAWTCKKILVLIGVTSLVSPLSLLSYYGNLLPYLASYYYARRDKISLYLDPLWPASVFRCTFTIAMLFTSPFELRFGIRRCIIAGVLLLWISVMSCYFAVQEPLALVLLFGGTHGTAVGIIYPTTLKLLLQALPDKAGLATGLLSIGPVAGALINIGVAFAVINPFDKKPDLYVDNRVFFSDPHIIHMVPYYFLVIGVIVVACTSIGVILAFIGSARPDLEPGINDMATEIDQLCNKLNVANEPADETKKTSLSKSSGVIVSSVYTSSEKDKLNGNGQTYSSVTFHKQGDHSLVNGNKNTDQTEEKKGTTQLVVQAELSPREAMKTGKLWCIWLCYICTSHTFYLQSNLYKQYGQLSIDNDSILVLIGILGMAVSMIGRPTVGLCSDKFGIRKTTMVVSLISSIFIALMVVFLRRCPPLFAILVVLEFLAISPQTMIFSLLTTFEFGKTHCASNIGLVTSGNIIVLLLEPFIADGMVGTVGWDWLFLTGSATAAVSMVTVMTVECIYPKKNQI